MPVEERLRNDEAKMMLTKEPPRLARWGITIIFFVLCALFIVSLLVTYSDVIKVKILLTKENEPFKIVAKSNGSIDLLVKENQPVKADSYLAIIQNTTDSADVFFLRNLLLYDRKGSYLINYLINQKKITPDKKLGNLQSWYLILYKAIDNYKLFKQVNYYSEQIASKRQQISHYQNMFVKAKQKTSLLNKELNQIQKDYNIDKQLFKNNTFAEQKLRNTGKLLLQKQSDLVDNKENEITILNNIEKLKENLVDLFTQEMRDDNEYKMSIERAYEQLKNIFFAWEKDYVLKAPVEGHVSFFKFINNKQFIKANENVLSIIPKDADSTIIGKVNTSIAASGKIREGQMMNIKLDNYPYHEYGILHGEVISVSLIPEDKQYAVKVKLVNGLTTSYKKQIPFAQQLNGYAEVITKKSSLAERIFYQISSLFKN